MVLVGSEERKNPPDEPGALPVRPALFTQQRHEAESGSRRTSPPTLPTASPCLLRKPILQSGCPMSSLWASRSRTEENSRLQPRPWQQPMRRTRQPRRQLRPWSTPRRPRWRRRPRRSTLPVPRRRVRQPTLRLRLRSRPRLWSSPKMIASASAPFSALDRKRTSSASAPPASAPDEPVGHPAKGNALEDGTRQNGFPGPTGPTRLLRRLVGPSARKTTFSWPS